MSRAARIEARAREIAEAFARQDAPGFITKGVGAPALTAYLPAARVFADTEDRIRKNGKRLKKMARALESMQPAAPTLPAGMHPFDPAKWEARLVPSTAPQLPVNGHDPLAPYRDGGADG